MGYKEKNKFRDLLVMLTGLLVLSLVFQTFWPSLVATVVGIIGLVSPKGGTLIVKGWLKLAEGLGWVNSRIILTLIYVVYLIPFSVIFRMTQRNPLDLKKVDGGSLFHQREHKYVKKDLDKVW